jgi:hypothetical protein
MLIAEYWGGPDQPIEGDPDAHLMAFASIVYRYPGSFGGSEGRGE